MTQSLDSFLGGTPAVPGESSEVQVPREAPQAPEPDPEFVTSVTPAGIEVYYQWAPKRLYRVRRALPYFPDRGETEAWSEWVEVPSVTTALGFIEGVPPWWGMRIGIAGIVDLYQRFDPGTRAELIELLATEDHARIRNGEEDAKALERLLTKHKITVNHITRDASDRGVSVHDAWEKWTENGILPHPELYPASERGYVEGLRKFIDAVTFTDTTAEVMVGSLEHRFAGRYDLRGLLEQPTIVQTRVFPKRAPRLEEIPAGKYLLDLKTSKGVYPKHLFQVEGYEGGSIECGYEPTDYRAVVRVTRDGEYEFVISDATFDDYLAMRRAYDALERVKGAK